MDYYDIPKYMKRYSFVSKMNACQKHSLQIITLLGIISPDKMNKQILPWELETFLLFAIEGDEYQDTDILDKNERRFAEIINAIRNHDNTERLLVSGEGDFASELIMRNGLIQFDLQEQQSCKYYRYNYFFSYVDETNDINMKDEFASKFGVEYKEILKLGFALNLFLSSHKASSEMINFIINYYGKAIQPLIITREGYKRLLRIFAKSIDDYEFCVRPSYSYPFINDGVGGIHLPLPHLLYRATTSALLYRITDNNFCLREKIGNFVVESYLLKILKASKAYDEVSPERKYMHRSTESKSPDISIKAGESFLFIESKSSVPPMGIRLFDGEAQNRHIVQIAQAINQLYKQIKLFIEGKYYVFSEEFPKLIESSQVWGVVSVLEDSFVSRKAIYKEFAKLAEISIEGEDYHWVINHIKVVSLYDIEKYSFLGKSIIAELSDLEKRDQPYDLALINIAGEKIVISDYRNFLHQTARWVEEMTEQMQKAGIIS